MIIRKTYKRVNKKYTITIDHRLGIITVTYWFLFIPVYSKDVLI